MNHFFAPLTHLAAIKVSGDKAENFLQGQLTCDVREVSATQSHLAAHCSPKGRVLISLRIIKFNEQFYLILPRDNAEFAIQHLHKYAQLSRVNLILSEEITIIGCWGENFSHPQINNLPEQVDQVTANEQWLILRDSGKTARWMIIGNTEALNLTFNAEAKDWQLLDIQNCIAYIYPPTRDLFTPHMLNYPELNAVSFKKGCYTGQEIIARTQYLGKAKRHLHLVNIPIQNNISAGEKILNQGQQEVGIIVQSHSLNGSQLLLAIIQDEALSHEMFYQDNKLIFFSSAF